MKNLMIIVLLFSSCTTYPVCNEDSYLFVTPYKDRRAKRVEEEAIRRYRDYYHYERDINRARSERFESKKDRREARDNPDLIRKNFKRRARELRNKR